jgi:hypothetical protein
MGARETPSRRGVSRQFMCSKGNQLAPFETEQAAPLRQV